MDAQKTLHEHEERINQLEMNQPAIRHAIEAVADQIKDPERGNMALHNRMKWVERIMYGCAGVLFFLKMLDIVRPWNLIKP